MISSWLARQPARVSWVRRVRKSSENHRFSIYPVGGLASWPLSMDQKTYKKHTFSIFMAGQLANEPLSVLKIQNCLTFSKISGWLIGWLANKVSMGAFSL